VTTGLKGAHCRGNKKEKRGWIKSPEPMRHGKGTKIGEGNAVRKSVVICGKKDGNHEKRRWGRGDSKKLSTTKKKGGRRSNIDRCRGWVQGSAHM